MAAKDSKVFFSEEKKQKTFDWLSRTRRQGTPKPQTGGMRASRPMGLLLITVDQAAHSPALISG